MSKIPRRKSKTGIYHVILRGVNKSAIFEDEMDYKTFIRHMGAIRKKYDIKNYCYCLMSNHVHMLLYDPKDNLSQAVHDLAIIYAKYANDKYGRVGHLFQARFHSKPVTDRKYFYQLVQYILYNPQKAGIGRYHTYPWSSYRDYVYGFDTTDTSALLGELGNVEKFTRLIADGEKVVPENCEMGDRVSDEEARLIIEQTAEMPAGRIQQLPVKERDRILAKIKLYHMSQKQISRITGISRAIVQRAE